MRRWILTTCSAIALLPGLALTAPASAQGQDDHPRGEIFTDCATACPEMVVVPAGTFMMGSSAQEQGRQPDEGPLHSVSLPRAFAVGRYEVTYNEWDACVTEGGCPEAVDSQTEGPGHDEGWGRGRRPVVNVSWVDAQSFVSWLSTKTSQPYRLLTESEWEYSARAETTTPFSTGNTVTADEANFDVTGQSRTMPVGSFAANSFGLYDMHGNVWEWVEDCYNANYLGVPTDGSASSIGDCRRRVLRGGSWFNSEEILRSAVRPRVAAGNRSYFGGFRVARSL